MKTALIVIVCVIAFVLIAVLITGFVFVGLLIRRDRKFPDAGEGLVSPLHEPTGQQLIAYNASKIKKFCALPMEDVEIKSDEGFTLFGRLYRGTAPVTVICCHGYRSAPMYDYCAISEMFIAEGYSLLFPDMRGHGKSGGRYVGFGVTDTLDVRRWVQKAEELFPGNDIFLHGVSMGATAVLNSADLFHYGEVSGIIADCGFTCPHDVFSHLIGDMYHLPRFPFVGAFELANMLTAKYDFHTYDVRYALAESSVPCIYICGEEDRFIPREMAQSIAERCRASLFVPGAGHAASYMTETDGYRKLVLGMIESTGKS